MKDNNTTTRGYFDPADCDAAAFAALIAQDTTAEQVPFASDIQKKIPIYAVQTLADVLADPARRKALMAEWARVMLSGAGIVVLQGAYADTGVLDEATKVYEAIIAAEKLSGSGGDHFAAAGANDRVWNALQKLCVQAPSVYARYFANPAIAAICEAWLGPGYQMTAQVNLVHPGGAAQQAHRDYHLGFQSASAAAHFPVHAHDLSPLLTLQGAIAHCDMPVESGPTQLLPFSQAYRPGYVAFRQDPFRALFDAHAVQIPLTKGDAVFFNPAVFHAAGANKTGNIHRLANLLQVSSAFGRATEAVDRHGMCKTIYPILAAARKDGQLDPAEVAALIAATAEGYAFPTNLDSDPPVGGLAPESQQAFFHRALADGMSPSSFAAKLDEMARKRLP
ncbi:phytanoyl-CoA dioxygenase family protein [Yoonia sp. SS1-5]|uniref:Phytanoyl-CoA dioxygenase family protein n=1 Tax=Yoonia rhodophyticola TaxID=3137370 RepID=A0AAN0MKI8_9RHOB